ncbi:MAG TPA: recombinase family protein [Rubrobacter sp.]|nr:recombinase family protein [Rubrobacter sp.]
MADGRKTRAAVYARVSKDDGSRETENQFRALRAGCERLGYDLVGEYVDRESGRKGRGERSGFVRLFEDAERRRLDLVMFWSLDRFSRDGIRKTIGYLQRLDHLGVRFRSHTEPYLTTDNELIAHIVLGVTSYYAQLEAARISERTKAGLKRARAQGKAIGRPDGFERWSPELASMRQVVKSSASCFHTSRKGNLFILPIRRSPGSPPIPSTLSPRVVRAASTRTSKSLENNRIAATPRTRCGSFEGFEVAAAEDRVARSLAHRILWEASEQAEGVAISTVHDKPPSGPIKLRHVLPRQVSCATLVPSALSSNCRQGPPIGRPAPSPHPVFPAKPNKK